MRGDIRAAEGRTVLDKLRGKQQHHILQVAYDEMDELKRDLLSRFARLPQPDGLRGAAAPEPVRERGGVRASAGGVGIAWLALHRRGERALRPCHPIVRQYAYDRLGDKEGVHSQLRDYFDALPAPDKVESVDDLAPVMELYHHTVGAGGYDKAFELFRDRLAEPLYFRFGAYQKRIELLRALFLDGEARPPRLADESAQAWTLNVLGNSYSLSGQPGRAVPVFKMATELAERFGGKRNVAIGLSNLADDQSKLGELAAAERNLRRRIELSREIKDERSEAIGHQGAGPSTGL